MATATRYTIWVIVAAAVLLILYDVIVMWMFGVSSTISRVTLDSAVRLPVIPFLAGVLCGHFFWPQPATKQKGGE